MNLNSVKVYVAMLFAMVFWGFSFIWTKQVLDVYQPFTIIFARLVIASSFMALLNIWLKRIKPLKKTDFVNILILSFFEPFLYFLGENYGLVYVSSTVAAVLIALIPLFSPIAAAIFYKQKIALLNIVGILISIFGVVLVIFTPQFNLKADPIGVMLIILAVFSAVAYSLMIMRISTEVSVVTIIFYQNFFGIFWFLPFFLIFELNNFIETGFVLKPFLNIIQLAIFASSVAFLLFTFGLRKLGITAANLWGNLIPVFTAFFAWVLLNEKLSWMNVFGIFIVIVGLLFSQTNQKILAIAKQYVFKPSSNKDNIDNLT